MIVGERIRQAREMFQFTHTALIDEVGLPGFNQSRLSRIENGLADADPEIIELLAVALRVRSDFFARPALPALAPQSPQLRARSRLTTASKTAVMRWAQTILEEYYRLEQSASPLMSGLEDMQDARPAEAAGRMRQLLGFDDFSPLPYLVLAVERLGVSVLGIPRSEDHMDAFCAWSGDRPIIGILAGTPADRLRFSVAHELGHLVLHRHVNRRPTVEAEADSFASELLTPRAAMGVVLLRNPTLSQLAIIKSEWGVSVKNLIRRSRELGFIDQDRAVSLYKQMSARGWNKKEPGFVSYEKPRAFRKLAEISHGPGPNVEAMARSAAWSETLVMDVLNRHARIDELPHESAPIRHVRGINVVDLASVRRKQQATGSPVNRILL
ncbi:MAG: ImmA/IrrE family metallo-endopeptidase [Pseudonocardiales bacterium]|nr:ImmA/IrrE family metallo-endopeptidase [Pseudonocardiales bacterium]